MQFWNWRQNSPNDYFASSAKIALTLTVTLTLTLTLTRPKQRENAILPPQNRGKIDFSYFNAHVLITKWKWLFCHWRQNSVFPLLGLGFGLGLGLGLGLEFGLGFGLTLGSGLFWHLQQNSC